MVGRAFLGVKTVSVARCTWLSYGPAGGLGCTANSPCLSNVSTCSYILVNSPMLSSSTEFDEDPVAFSVGHSTGLNIGGVAKKFFLSDFLVPVGVGRTSVHFIGICNHVTICFFITVKLW